ncbi:Holliday junction branch migration protein RuvA [Nisaea acidiphila]|uniref:Holliday junction branch migration complex subunit RuvA n=1 Tax=Nisaea acidiphila TaxID=1862145 RepID=A0A9J7APC3_9PROT|nr:Holliday junction branch migration protein RuvA [Nisaea acidiphila]UUX48770.1 Holliday junction branch migration protein RuvA [Nisaea acidiphila]
MIAKLRGILDSFGDGSAVIDVAGVGYLIFASSRTLAKLGDRGGEVSVHVETHVREDHIHLYGFADKGEQDCFKLLQTVQGVGAKAALSILSALSPDEIIRAVAAGDAKMLTRADGVGPKLAGRIVNELKDKAVNVSLGADIAATAPAGKGAAPANESAAVADAISALVNLGYDRSVAYGAVHAAAKSAGADAGLDQLITGGLKELAS